MTSGAGKPVLLAVDDDEGMRDIIAWAGRRAGFDVRTTGDPYAAVEMDTSAIDAIVLDLAMPRMDGIAALRQFASRGCRSHIVLLSGADEAILRTAAQVGRELGLAVAGHWRKPMRVVELVELLREAIAAPSAPAAAAGPVLTAADLGRGLAAGEIVPHYQPVVRLATGEIEGAEALARWRHPEHGLIEPSAFVPLAEGAGLGLKLTEVILYAALADRAAWRREGGGPEALAVNLPPDALTDLGFPDRVSRTLENLGVRPEKLTFEVTETSVVREMAKALDILARLRLKGVRLAIDDFGTGYSSMEQLRRMPFTTLKIDMGFVRRIPEDPVSRAIVRRTIALGHDLGMSVLAEGVEDARALDMLREAGCDLIQGYLVSRPLPPAEFAAFARSWAASLGGGPFGAPPAAR